MIGNSKIENRMLSGTLVIVDDMVQENRQICIPSSNLKFKLQKAESSKIIELYFSNCVFQKNPCS